MFAPRGHCLWDPWLIQHEGRYHLFHLQAPRTPAGIAERHNLATIGHAVSIDLVDWEACDPALSAGPAGSWDDLCLWTGSVIKRNACFYMLYTGRCRDEPNVQRIGLARSDDLYRWEKHPNNPVSSADSRWYETIRTARYPTEDWRDPFLFYDEKDVTYYALITARDRITPPPYGGCIALAKSSDLVDWKCSAPLSAPGLYKEMECPQVFRKERHWFLIFSTHDVNYAPSWAARCGGAQTGAHFFAADDVLGTYRPIGDSVLLGSTSHCYGTKICRTPDGSDVALSWLLRTEDSSAFAGYLDVPRKVTLVRDRLEIVRPGPESEGR